MLFSFLVSLVLWVSPVNAESDAKKTLDPITQNEIDELEKRGRRKLMFGLLGSKTLSEAPGGNHWNFDQPSLGVETDVNEFIAVNLAVNFLQQQYLIDKDGFDVLQERLRAILPVMVAYRAFSWLSISAGPYIGFALKEATVHRRGLPPGAKPPSSSMDDFLEFGFSSSVQFIIPVTERVEGMISVHYYEPYDDAIVKKANSVFFLVGSKFGFK